MIDTSEFYDCLVNNDVNYFTGVPDSLLKSFCAYISDNVDVSNNVIAANEGASVGLAVGYHLATDGVPLVYMQNSGFGNVVNPLLSLADSEVYSIPMLLLIGWRGQPGVKDEPQHVKQGRVTEALLETMEVPYFVLRKGASFIEIKDAITELISNAKANARPVAILVEKGAFSSYSLMKNVVEEQSLELTREKAIEIVLDNISDQSPVVSTTGMASREVFEFRARHDQGHHRDFLTVGGMGHASQIAMGLASQLPNKKIICLDGDGAMIMHMGSLAISGASNCNNLLHIVLNNGAHDSVGGQPTEGFNIDICGIARSCGYDSTSIARTEDEIITNLSESLNNDGLSMMEIRVKKGNRSDIGRPTITPIENKLAFAHHVRN